MPKLLQATSFVLLLLATIAAAGVSIPGHPWFLPAGVCAFVLSVLVG